MGKVGTQKSQETKDVSAMSRNEEKKQADTRERYGIETGGKIRRKRSVLNREEKEKARRI